MAAPPRALDRHAAVGPKNITGRLLELSKFYACYTSTMTKRLEEVVADVRELPEDEQDRVAEALLAFLREWQDDFRLMV